MTRETLLDLIGKYRHLGLEYVPDTGAMLIGRASHIGLEAWLNIIYNPITEDDIVEMEKSMKRTALKSISQMMVKFIFALQTTVHL